MTLKVYVHKIDDYAAKYIAKHLSNAIHGSTLNSEGEEEIEEENVVNKNNERYEIITTTEVGQVAKPGITYLPQAIDLQDLVKQTKDCKFFVFNIFDNPDCVDDVRDMIDLIAEESESFSEQKIIVLISTLLTWARSKVPDEDDPEIPFTDEDYCRRIAHSNYRAQLDLEKEVLKIGKKHKPKLLTYVISCGIPYGEEESIFHPFFQEGWHNASQLEFPGNGQNIVPTIHVNDLAKIVQSVFEYRPLVKYVLATDDSQNTLYQLIKSISRMFTTSGKVKRISKEEFYQKKGITQQIFDHLLINLRIDSAFAKENLNMHWSYESGMAENIRKISKEFRLARNLIPFKLCILGPPLSGKSTISAEFAKQYKIHHIEVNKVVEDTIKELDAPVQVSWSREKRKLKPQVSASADRDQDTWTGASQNALHQEISAARLNAPQVEQTTQEDEELIAEDLEEEEENDEEAKATEDAEFLETLNASKAENDGQLDQEYVIQFLRKKLNSKPCKNQGFLLDGFPTTKEEAENLFNEEGDENEEEEEEEEGEEKDEAQEEPVKKQSSPDNADLDPIELDKLNAKDATLLVDEELAVLEIKRKEEERLRCLKAEPDVFEASPVQKTLPKGIAPTHVFVLQATDEMLKNRVMGLPESEWQMRNLNEETFLQKLTQYRANEVGTNALLMKANSVTGAETSTAVSTALTPLAESAIDEESLMAFIEDQGMQLMPLDVAKTGAASAPLNSHCLEVMKFVLGPPRNYGISEELLAQQQEMQEQERKSLLEANEKKRQKLLDEEAAARAENETLYAQKLKELSEEEQKILEENTKPVTEFMTKFIIPTLLSGLIDTFNSKPEDPIDHLAKYLFRNNPQI
ncbi:Adenylate kinase 7 [Cichlidogyrus casuarinus]|uniref:Adenylate kinase 7 n=1 Tax=Cichlidogyrus casuarinus TaxID=1844966 RepID=A0ABD2QI33_9PLAT